MGAILFDKQTVSATVFNLVNRQVGILPGFFGASPKPRDCFRHWRVFNERVWSRLVVAWRNGAWLCGDATMQGISKAECVNDAQERLIIYWSNARIFSGRSAPELIFLDECVQNRQEFTHRGNQRNFFLFPIRQHTQIKLADGWVVSCCG